MSNIIEHQLTDLEIKGIWCDTYKMFLQYKDVDCAECEDEINLAAKTIEMNYDCCDLAMYMTSAVIRILIDRSETYKRIVEVGGETDGRVN